MILTLRELAEHLKVTDRTILRMLKTGQIQGVKIGGQWRFNGSQIDRVFFPEGPLGSDDVPLSELTRPQFEIPISRLVNENRVFDSLCKDNLHVFTYIIIVERNNHVLTAKYITWAQKDRVAQFLCGFECFLLGKDSKSFWSVDVKPFAKLIKPLAVFGKVNCIRARS